MLLSNIIVALNMSGYLKLLRVQKFYIMAWIDVAKGVIASNMPAIVGE